MDCGGGDVPYHARQDSRPFTYGLPGSQPHSSSDTNTMSSTSTSTTLRSVVYNGGGGDRETRTGLASPSLVRKASFGKKSPAPPTTHNGYAGNNNTNTWSSASSNKSGWNSTLSSDAHLYSNG